MAGMKSRPTSRLARLGAATLLGLGALALGSCGSTNNATSTTGTVRTDPLTFQNTTIPVAYVGEEFQASLRVSGGVGPYGYRLTSGSLPPGITFRDGQLSGKPTAQGAYSFTVEANDANLSNKVASYTVNVSEQPPLSLKLTLPTSEIRGETRIPVTIQAARNVRATRFTWKVGPDVQITRVQGGNDGSPLFWRQVGDEVTVDLGFKTVPRSGARVALISVKPQKPVQLTSQNFWYDSRDAKGQVLGEQKRPAPAPTPDTKKAETTAPETPATAPKTPAATPPASGTPTTTPAETKPTGTDGSTPATTPANTTPASANPASTNPGTTQPGTTQPGTTQPEQKP